MSMFCYQCQETLKNVGCVKKGVCGKSEDTANLQDLLLYVCKGISVVGTRARKQKINTDKESVFITKALFSTITNANFDSSSFRDLIAEGLQVREDLKVRLQQAGGNLTDLHACAVWNGNPESWNEAAAGVGVLSTEDVNIRSLRELLTYGLKGIAAYSEHALVLGRPDPVFHDFSITALEATTRDLDADELVGLVLKCGEVAVSTMALLDAANTETYGNPEITHVKLGVGTRPGILISGHDLKDFEMLLEQSKDAGVDVYTHGEMLPGHYYPKFKTYPHLVGNYGGAWYDQKKEFATFNGPILMTTNCLVPPSDDYRSRLYTTGVVGFEGIAHIAPDDRGHKDFSAIIEQAKTCAPPSELETGTIVGGFAHNQVLALADKVVDGVKSGAIRKFVVMAGCDGRQAARSYFTDVAQQLPADTIILTAGCAKYRYNKLNLGDIGGIPRVLDAGQCNDSYSLAIIAMKLKEVFELESVNDLPLDFDIAWYEQKAVAVLLALLHLGFKGVRIGPTLPAFLSADVARVLVETFDLKGITDAASDVKAITA